LPWSIPAAGATSDGQATKLIHKTQLNWNVSSDGVGPRSHFDPLLKFESYFPTTRVFLDAFEAQLAHELPRAKKAKIDFDTKVPALRGVLAKEITSFGQEVAVAARAEYLKSGAPFEQLQLSQLQQLKEENQNLQNANLRLATEVQWWRRNSVPAAAVEAVPHASPRVPSLTKEWTPPPEPSSPFAPLEPTDEEVNNLLFDLTTTDWEAVLSGLHSPTSSESSSD
jgi:hypothetical protein